MILLKSTILVALSLLICARNLENIPSLNADLQQKINRYQNDIKTLQQQVQKVKQQLEKAKTQPSFGFASVQEGIANQRDLLRTIQSYLTLPFNISSCDCYELNQNQRQRVLKQISSIKKGLQKLSTFDGLDQDCKQYTDVRKEITREKAYIEKIQESLLNSSCALKLQKKQVNAQSQTPSGIVNIAQSEYQTNLKAQNLCFGKLTQDQVKLLWFAFTVKNNVTNCPLETPFYNGVSCIACKDDTPYFDLSLKKCIFAKGVDKNKQCIDPSLSADNRSDQKDNNQTSTDSTYKEIPVEPLIDKPIIKSVTLNKENRTNEEIVRPIQGKAIISKQRSTTRIGYEQVQPIEKSPLIRVKRTKYTSGYESVSPIQEEPLSKVIRTQSSSSFSRRSSSVSGLSSRQKGSSSNGFSERQSDHRLEHLF